MRGGDWTSRSGLSVENEEMLRLIAARTDSGGEDESLDDVSCTLLRVCDCGQCERMASENS